MNELLRKLLFLPEQASSMAPEIDHLHYFVIGVTMVGWVVVTLAALFFIVRFRRRRDSDRTKNVRAAFVLEVGVAGVLLALFLVWWGIGYRQYVKLQEPPEDAMDVYVMGKQWMWKFAYPDGRSSVAVLTVPVNQPVRLLMISRDVIHSFFVPAFRIKHDVLPGRYTIAWFEATEVGTYDVMCTEFCGLSHSNMLGKIVVLSPEDFQRWQDDTMPKGELFTWSDDVPASLQPALAQDRTGVNLGLKEQGNIVARKYGCFGCHSIDGRPHIGPTWLGLFASEVTLNDGTRLIADETYLTRSMMQPNTEIVRGFDAVMPSYQGLLAPAETAALVELIRSLRFAKSTGPVLPVWDGRPIKETAP